MKAFYIKRRYLRKLPQFGFTRVRHLFVKNEGDSFTRVNAKTGKHYRLTFETTEIVVPLLGDDPVEVFTTTEVNDEPRLPEHMWEVRDE